MVSRRGVDFSVVALWADGTSMPILRSIPRYPYTHRTVSTPGWIQDITLWILGGLVNTGESRLYEREEGLRVRISSSANIDVLPFTWTDAEIPLHTDTVYVHLPLGFKKPSLVPTTWNNGKEDRNPSSATRFIVQTRSDRRCVLGGEAARGVLKPSDTHQLCHVVAKFCSPAAMDAFTAAVRRSGTTIPHMRDLQQPPNLVWMAKMYHGPYDQGKWGIYCPLYVYDDSEDLLELPYAKITAPALQFHQFQDSDDLNISLGHHSLKTALEDATSGRLSPWHSPFPGALSHLFTEGDSFNPFDSNQGPHPLLLRIQYAATCILEYASPQIAALAFGWKPDYSNRDEPGSRRGDSAHGRGGREDQTGYSSFASNSGLGNSDVDSYTGGAVMTRGGAVLGSGSSTNSSSGGYTINTAVTEPDEGSVSPFKMVVPLNEHSTYLGDEDEDDDEEEMRKQAKHRVDCCHFIMGNYIRQQEGRRVPLLIARVTPMA
ncbi:hypothetical protein K438DRAFT_554209 [Mycena galopus ATCC 62051]|nr:hypothetical protein K438DRAFT_554209 [Mycena galopus ATCC 62051]